LLVRFYVIDLQTLKQGDILYRQIASLV